MNLHKTLPCPLKVTVLHLPYMGSFVTPHGELFVSVTTLNVARNDDELAIVLANEIAHYALDHTVRRLFRMVFVDSWLSLINFSEDQK